MNFVIVPVKQLSSAKERLAFLLSPIERRSLALAMLEDVVTVLCSSRKLDGVVVISNDPIVWEMAKNLGALVIEELLQEGENVSVEQATKICMNWGASSVLVVPSDIPLITLADVDFLIEKSKNDDQENHSYTPRVILVPSLDHKGTNALLRRPPDIIPTHFGYNSFQAHIAEAEKQQIPYKIWILPRIALDIDSPEDLRLFLSTENQTQAYQELIRMGIPLRLKQ